MDPIAQKIYSIRGLRVMLDSDLADLYGVSTRHLNQAVLRNLARFPPDFRFQLSRSEFQGLMSHFVTSKKGRGGRQKSPYAFTEHGAVMLAGVLKSAVADRAELARKIERLEWKFGRHDAEIRELFDLLRLLNPTRRIGFETGGPSTDP